MSYAASRVFINISSILCCLSGLSFKMSYNDCPAILACDHTANSESPCSPDNCASTLQGDTLNSLASSYLKRAVSNIVPEPITCAFGKPDTFCVTYDNTSTGFVAIRKIPLNPVCIIVETISLNRSEEHTSE